MSKDVLERGGSIINFADQKQWDQLKEELEATQNEVKSGMAESKDGDLITLVTVGGWLRATEVMSGYVAKNYTEAGAKLLRQPGIVAFSTSAWKNSATRPRRTPAWSQCAQRWAISKNSSPFRSINRRPPPT